MLAFRLYLAMLDALFSAAFETHVMRPGESWIVPLCSRGLGDKRQFPHVHVLFMLNYDGMAGIGAIEITEGFSDERTCNSATTV